MPSKLAALIIGLALVALTCGVAPARANASCVQRVVLFEMVGCPYCAATRAFLDENRIPFERIETWRNPQAQAFMTKEFGTTAVPVVLTSLKTVLV